MATTARGSRPRLISAKRAARLRKISLLEVQRLATARALSAAEVATLPDAVLRRALRRLHYSDLPIAREQFRLLHLQTDGAAPLAGRRLRAVWHQDSLRQRQDESRVAGVPVGAIANVMALAQPTAGVHAGSWLALGPGNIGGRTRAIVIDPSQPNTIWAGAAGGGIWRTINGGTSWAPVDDLMANLAVCSLAMSPVNFREIYAGTGEGFSNVDAIRGAGIFWTRDAATWSQITATSQFTAVNRIAISADGYVVLAATPGGIYRTDDPTRGSWSAVLQSAVATVQFHPTNPALAVAGGLSDGNSYYSGDGGQTWKVSTHTQPWGGRVELAFAVKSPSIVYASVNMNSGSIWRSQDGGKTFRAMNTRAKATNAPAHYLGDQGWYANAIWAGDPNDENSVIVGGLDLWRSSDGGNTLDQISLWYATGSAHADQHCMVNHPAFGPASRTVFFGNDGGIYRADNYLTVGSDTQHAQGWTALDNSYGVTQFYGGAGNAQSGVVVGGAQDNGTIRCTPASGQSWNTMFGGDGGWCAADPNDPNYFYGEYVYLNVCRSTDGGGTADYISGQVWNGHQWTWRPPPYRIPDAMTNQALFIAPFVLDPNDSNRILAGGVSLWQTMDAKTPNDDQALTGPSWAPIKNSIGSHISTIAIAPGDSANIWIGHESGAVFRTANGTVAVPTWQQIGGSAGFPLPVARYCSSIVIDPQDSGVVYVTFAAYRGGGPSNVWKTADGGRTWQDIGHGLPDAPVHKLARHPAQPNFLYLGTEVGFLASDDGGVTWSPTNEGPTNCPVYDLFWMGNTLVSTTHGRGMFSIQL